MSNGTKKVVTTKTKTMPAMAGIDIVVGDDEARGAFKAKDVLQTEIAVATFFKALVADSDADKDVKARVAKATPTQIVNVVKNTDVSGASAEESANIIRVQAICAARFAVDTSSVPTGESIRTGISAGDVALTLGGQVPDDVKADLDKTIDATLKADAGPTLMSLHFKEKWKDLQVKGRPWLESVPPIGSKYLTIGKGTGNKAPPGFFLPDDTDPKHGNAIWHGPYDHYTQTVRNPDGTQDQKNKHFVAEMVAAKLAYGLSEQLDHIRAAIGGRYADDCPKDIKALGQGGSDGKRVLQEMATDVAFQFQRRVRIVSTALEILQGEQAITKRFPDVAVLLTATTPGFKKQTNEEMARSKKPFCLRTMAKAEDGTPYANYHGPYPVAVIRNAAKKIAGLQENAKLADFLAPKPKQTELNKKAPASAGASRIKTIEDFASYVYEVHGYLKADKTKMLLDRCNDPVKGGEFCSAVVSVWEALAEVVEQEGIKERALAFSQATAKAMADAETSKAAA